MHINVVLLTLDHIPLTILSKNIIFFLCDYTDSIT